MTPLDCHIGQHVFVAAVYRRISADDMRQMVSHTLPALRAAQVTGIGHVREGRYMPRCLADGTMINSFEVERSLPVIKVRFRLAGRELACPPEAVSDGQGVLPL